VSGGWRRPRLCGASLARLAREVDADVLQFQLKFELRLWLRRRFASLDTALPTALYLETSSFCAGACADCYVPAADRRQHLGLDAGTLERLLADAERLPLAFVCLVGGEPLDGSVVERNLRLVREHPRTRFLICTSGEPEIGPELGRAIGALRNLSLLVSFEGLPETHRRIRPRGSFERACAALDALRRHGRSLCGASVTLRTDNWREATSRAFVDRLGAAGCHFLSYAPCETRDGRQALSPERYAGALARLATLSASSPALLFCHPFGQIAGGRVAPVRRLRTLTVDYAGNVYAARRGPSFGNVHEADLATLLARPALRACYGEPEWSGAARLRPAGDERALAVADEGVWRM
jgi:MoaA/NifB/PqqE/SkfB family radical SAM enzyme